MAKTLHLVASLLCLIVEREAKAAPDWSSMIGQVDLFHLVHVAWALTLDPAVSISLGHMNIMFGWGWLNVN